jgi:hypothetical protein
MRFTPFRNAHRTHRAQRRFRPLRNSGALPAFQPRSEVLAVSVRHESTVGGRVIMRGAGAARVSFDGHAHACLPGTRRRNRISLCGYAMLRCSRCLFSDGSGNQILRPAQEVFAKLKHLMRKAAERTIETTWKRIGPLLHGFQPEEGQRYLSNAGYAST